MAEENNNNLLKKVEALLFSSGKGMTVEEISKLIDVHPSKVKVTLSEIKNRYENTDTALKIIEQAGFWKMSVKDEYADVAKSIVVDADLPKAVLETLAIITYRYPAALQSDVIRARGETAYEHIKELLDLGFITRERKGLSYIIKLTKKFFDYFDLEGEKDLKEALQLKALETRQILKQEKKLDEVEVYKSKGRVGGKKEKEKLLGELEVVDIPESDKEHIETEEKEKVEFVKPDITPYEKPQEEIETESNFLSEIDKKIEELSIRRKEREQSEPKITKLFEENNAEEEKEDKY